MFDLLGRILAWIVATVILIVIVLLSPFPDWVQLEFNLPYTMVEFWTAFGLGAVSMLILVIIFRNR